MRRYFVLLLAILLMLCGCAVPTVHPESGETPTDAPTAQADALALPGDGVIRDRVGNSITLQALGRDISFYTIGQVQYWRVRLPGVGKYGEPSLFLLTDNDALQAFAVDHGLTEGYAHYEDDFFKKQDLLLIGLETPSGSIRYGVEQLTRDANGALLLEITHLHPYETEDMADWQIAIPVKKGALQPGDVLQLRVNDAPGGSSKQSVSGAMVLSLPFGGMYDEPLSSPFLLYGRELSRFAAWYGLTTPYAALIRTVGEDEVLLVVPVREEVQNTVFSLTYAQDSVTGKLALTVRESREAGSARIEDVAYHLVVPIRLSGDTLPEIDVNYEREETPLPGAAEMQVLRIGLYRQLAESLPQERCLRSAADLALLARISGGFPERVKQDVGALTDLPIAQMLATYDESFFATHDLLLIPHVASSGSNRHEIKQVRADADGVCVEYACVYPAIGTSDVAYWTLLAPVQKGAVPANGRFDTHRHTVSLSGGFVIESP